MLHRLHKCVGVRFRKKLCWSFFQKKISTEKVSLGCLSVKQIWIVSPCFFTPVVSNSTSERFFVCVCQFAIWQIWNGFHVVDGVLKQIVASRCVLCVDTERIRFHLTQSAMLLPISPKLASDNCRSTLRCMVCFVAEQQKKPIASHTIYVFVCAFKMEFVSCCCNIFATTILLFFQFHFQNVDFWLSISHFNLIKTPFSYRRVGRGLNNVSLAMFV